MVRNVLFIMADQLRRDHLACYGHPYMRTPNIDALARRGVRFEQAYVNSGVCGPSRMSYYTGRYPASHGATWNRVPLSVGEITLGEYLRDAGRELALAGKTHVMPDRDGMARLHLDGHAELGHLLERGCFVELDRYDGHHTPGSESGYPAFLRAHGYQSADPWSDFVISGVDSQGRVCSGWHMRNVHLPSRVREEHSETAYMTDQAMRFISGMAERPWVLHLSYVKPHWPYMAPAPYHAAYTAGQCLPVLRSRGELRDAHPVLRAYRDSEESRSFSMDECVRVVRPAYQGLIEQLDTHLGRLFEHMDRLGVLRETLVILCSDHGDFLGDHWLGEKELFYDMIQRVPLIVVDPSAAADVSRGRVDSRMVESVDIVPTILQALDLPVPQHRIEGRALQALLHDDGQQAPAWRDMVFSELDYSFKQARRLLGQNIHNAYAYSCRDTRWRYVYWLDQPEQLYDLQADPHEMNDLGRDPSTEGVRQQLRTRLLDWLARRKRRTTISDDMVEMGTAAHKRAGVFFGQW